MGVTGDRLGSVRGVSRNCSGSVLEIVRECLGSVLAVSGERLGCEFGVLPWPEVVGGGPQFQKEKKKVNSNIFLRDKTRAPSEQFRLTRNEP